MADCRSDRLYFVLVETEFGGCQVVFEVCPRCGAGDWEGDGRDCEHPREGNLVGVRPVAGCGRREELPVGGIVPSTEGAVGDESDLVRLALGEHVAPAVVGEVESALHGADLSDRAGARELLEGDVGDADVPDLALALEVLERADRLQEGDGWVGCVQLVELDAIQFKPAQRRLAGGPQVIGAAVGRPPNQPAAGEPAAGPGAFVAALGRDEKAVIGREGFGDELLRDTGPLGVGCVDELDSQLDRSAQ